MPSERTLIAAEEGVEIWQIDLSNEGTSVETTYLVKSLRTPDSPSYASEAEARRAFEEEVKLSRASELV